MTNATRRAALAALAATGAQAQRPAADPVRVGIIYEASGVYASYGLQVRHACELYLREHGAAAGRPVELIFRDTGGANADLARRHAQDLIARERVHVLGGFGLTPIAVAVAPVANAARMPMVIMNAAATSGIVARSPAAIRVSFTMPQVTRPLARWAAGNGLRKVFTIVADYAPGADSEAAFRQSFTAAGGEIVGGVRFPLTSFDFAAYLTRAREMAPDAIFAFPGTGEGGLQLIKTFHERGLAQAGIRLIGIGDMTDDTYLDGIGDQALGIITSHHYSAAADNAQNRRFVAAWRAVHGPASRPNYYAAASWDGMAAIVTAIAALGDRFGGEAAIAALATTRIDGPRGAIQLDANRDVVQDIHIRRVERVNGGLYNVPFERFAAVPADG